MPSRHPVWSEASGRYRGARGRYLSRAQVRDYLDGAVERAAQRMQALGQQLQRREISIAEWQTQMRLSLRDVHGYSAAIAQGGLQQMTPREWGHVGAQLKDQYTRLGKLAREIETGRVVLDGRFLQRMRLYGLSGTATFEGAARRDQEARGLAEERNIRGKQDSCAGCLGATAAGWVPTGTLTLPGERDCLGSCGCKIERRKRGTTTARAA